MFFVAWKVLSLVVPTRTDRIVAAVVTVVELLMVRKSERYRSRELLEPLP
jgi:hypothetical protein